MNKETDDINNFLLLLTICNGVAHHSVLVTYNLQIVFVIYFIFLEWRIFKISHYARHYSKHLYDFKVSSKIVTLENGFVYLLYLLKLK